MSCAAVPLHFYGSTFQELLLQSNFSSVTSPIWNNLVLEQVVHRKNVSVAEQTGSQRVSRQPFHSDTCMSDQSQVSQV